MGIPQPQKRRMNIRYLRRKYRRYCLLTALIAGAIGVIAGTYCGYLFYNWRTSNSMQKSGDVIGITSEQPNTEVYSVGIPYELSVQTGDNGIAYFRFCCEQVLTPQYYTEHYTDQYQLSGNEACVVIMMELLEPSTVQTFDPQQHISIALETVDGLSINSYPLKNAEIAGEYNSVLEKGQSTVLYKRFQHDSHKKAAYLTLTYTDGNEDVKKYFALSVEN